MISTYFVYEKLNGEYNYIGTVKVADGEKAKQKAIEKYYKDIPWYFRPHVRVSTKPLGKHAKMYLPQFLSQVQEVN